MTRTACLVIDVQNDFCPGGSLAVAGGDIVATRISQYLADRHHDFVTVVTTQDWHPDRADFEHFSTNPDFDNTWPPHCVAGTPGAELHDNLSREWVRAGFKKGQTEAAYSGFQGVNERGVHLYTYLSDLDITAIRCVGIALEKCVMATAVDGAELGFDTTVLLDLTAALQPDETTTVTQDLINAGVSVADVLLND